MFNLDIPILSKREGRYFNTKIPLVSTSHPANPFWKWRSIKEQCPLWIQPWTEMLVEKACSYLTSSFCVENTMPPLMDFGASKNQSLLVYVSSTNKLFFVSKQIWKPSCSKCNLPVHNFYHNHEVLLKNPFSWLGAPCFPSGDAFLLIHPTSLLLLTFCQTRGFFCCEKYFLCFKFRSW